MELLYRMFCNPSYLEIVRDIYPARAMDWDIRPSKAGWVAMCLITFYYRLPNPGNWNYRTEWRNPSYI